ncbi:MAG TPA: ABC transporter permease [Gemmatimonadaceae bacterium]|nr:ABC transporter permease [Gemmatimonadaceae bacterium]
MSRTDLPQWHRYLRFWQSNIPADVEAEIAFHVDARTDELIAGGATPTDARERALREFGDVERARATLRDMDERHRSQAYRVELFTDLWQDIRVAARSLARVPGFVIVVALTLSLGIGLNSAIFSIVDAYLFRPIPVPNGNALVLLGQTDAALPAPHEMSYLNYLDYRADTSIFSALSAYSTNTMNLAGGRGAERIWTEETTANFFAMLGVKPLLGRVFRADEDQGELAHPVIVLTYDFWQAHFGGDTQVIGDTVRLNNHPITIIGVTPPDFHGVDPLLRVDGFTPINQTWPVYGASMHDRAASSFDIIGTLRSGVSLETARRAVSAKAKTLEREYPDVNRNVGIVLERETHTRPNFTVSANVPAIAAAFMTLVMLVLAVACANVSGLLLARATAHYKEHAVRAALGASQWRLARRVLIECVMLALIGGAGAVALASIAVRALVGVRVAADVPIHWTVALDAHVLAFTMLVVLATGVAASIAPVFSLRRSNLADVLKSGARGTDGHGHQRLRAVLVIAQIAVCVAIVVCAALFARSTANASRINVGYRTDHVLLATVSLAPSGYDSLRGKQFEAEALRRVAQLPGVRSAALARYTPFGYNNDIEYVKPETSGAKIPENGIGCFNNIVSPEYFATMSLPILEGRGFTAHDDEGAPKVAVVTKRFAARVWPGASAVGKRFRFRKDGPLLEVVGVSGDVQYFSVGEAPKPFFFRPYAQWYRPQFTLNVHTNVDPSSLTSAVRATLATLDPELPVFDVRSFDDHISNGRALLGTRLGAVFAAVFGALALSLAAVGLYGLMSYAVAQRTREIGIRVALGARTSGVVRLVMRQGLAISVIGVTIGTAMTLVLTGFLSKLLYGVAPRDPVIFVSVALTLAVVSAIAGVIPARRATRVDPLTALRSD